MFALTATLISALGLLTPSVLGYDNSRNDNVSALLDILPAITDVGA